MKPNDLISIWSAPDNSRITPKQYSFRLPVDVAARLAALCEVYPSRNRTEIVGDLLRFALLEVEKTIPAEDGRQFGTDPDTDEPLFEVQGLRRAYWQYANKEFAKLERELGNENPKELFPGA